MTKNIFVKTEYDASPVIDMASAVLVNATGASGREG